MGERLAQHWKDTDRLVYDYMSGSSGRVRGYIVYPGQAEEFDEVQFSPIDNPHVVRHARVFQCRPLGLDANGAEEPAP